jgi:hypothetical protein
VTEEVGAARQVALLEEVGPWARVGALTVNGGAALKVAPLVMRKWRDDVAAVRVTVPPALVASRVTLVEVPLK